MICLEPPCISLSCSVPLYILTFALSALAGALNLFWGVLKWKKMAEEALEASNMSYLIVRPGQCTGLQQELCCYHAPCACKQLSQAGTGLRPCLRLPERDLLHSAAVYGCQLVMVLP